MDLQAFVDELRFAPLNIPRAALYFARAINYPELDIAAVLTQLDELAAEVRPRLSGGMSLGEQAAALAHFLFQEQGFRGNVAEYDDPRNSFLNEVLERRLGIPITLSVLFVAVAQRVGLEAHGVGMPGHYIVSVSTEEERLLFDPFHGGLLLSLDDCARLVQISTGRNLPFQDGWLFPTAPEDTLARMLNNLRIIYMQRGNWPQALRVIEHLRLLQPKVPEHLRDMGLVLYQEGSYFRALQYLESYFATEPQGPDAEAIRQGLRPALDAWARLN